MLKAERQTDTHNEKQPIFTDFEQEPKAPSQIFYQAFADLLLLVRMLFKL